VQVAAGLRLGAQLVAELRWATSIGRRVCSAIELLRRRETIREALVAGG
jgi:hypothetical protein